MLRGHKYLIIIFAMTEHTEIQNQPIAAPISCHAPEAWSVDYVKKIWKDLEPNCHASFFQSWYWIDPWLTIASKHVTPVIFKSGDKIVGICFVGRGKSKDYRVLSFRTLYLFQTGVEELDAITGEYNNLLVLPEYAVAASRAFMNFCMRSPKFSKTERVMIMRMPENLLPQFNDDAYSLKIFRNDEAVVIHLAGAKEEKDLFSKSFLTKIRRSIKFYEEKYGSVQFERADSATQAQNWFAELGKLNQSRFRKLGQTSAWDRKELVRMHRALLDRYFHKGAAEVIRVKAGEKVLGYLYNFLYRGRVYFYMSGLEFEQDNKAKPGLMTHYFCSLNHWKNGMEFYDFMAGDYRYKYEMGTPGDKMISISLDKPGFKYKIARVITSAKNIVSKLKTKR